VNSTELENILQKIPSQSPRTPRKATVFQDSLMKSIYKKDGSSSNGSSPRLKISSPIIKNEQNNSLDGFDYTDIFNFEVVLNDVDSEVRIHFKIFLESFGPVVYFVYLHENIQIYKNSIKQNYKTVATKIQNDFFDPYEAKYPIKIEDFDSIENRNFSEIENYTIDLFDEMDDQIITNLKKGYFGDFVKSPEFQKLLKTSPDIIQNKKQEKKTRNTIGHIFKSKKKSPKSNPSQKGVPQDSSPITRKTSLNENRFRSPRTEFKEKMDYSESKKSQIFDLIINESKSSYRSDFKKYLETVSFAQYMNLHESIELYKDSREMDRDIQSKVLQKIIVSSSKTKHLLTKEQLEKMKNENDSTDIFDELDQILIKLFKEKHFPQFFMIENHKYLTNSN
jgi:hypothetical protein